MSDNPDFAVTSSWEPRTHDDTVGPNSEPGLGAADSANAIRLAWAPFAMLIVINLLVFTTRYVSEIMLWPPATRIRAQILSLSFIVPGDPNSPDSLTYHTTPLLALVAAAAYAIAAKTRARYIPPLTWVLALVVSALTALSVLPVIHAFTANATAICVAVVIIGMSLVAASRLHRTGDQPVSIGFNFGWVLAFGIAIAPPLAVGRWLYGDGIEVWAYKVNDPAFTLKQVATAWSVLIGVALAIGIWSVFQLIPPPKGKNIVGLAVLLVLAFGPGVALAGQYTKEANIALMKAAPVHKLPTKPPAKPG